MKKIYFFLIAFIIISLSSMPTANAQGGVAINAAGAPPDSSALFDLSSSNKGLLMPRLTTAQRDAIANPAIGLFIFNTDCKVVNYNAGTSANPNWATVNASNVLAAGVSIVASPLGAICAGTSVTFTATPSQNNLSPSYQWQVNGSNVGTNSSSYTTVSLSNGDIVTCILTSSVPCVTGSPATSNAITTAVNTVPSITGTTPATFCNGSAVTLSASANLGTINWYSDSTGGSSLSSGASFTTSGLGSTTTFYVDATANGCTTAGRTAVTATFYPNSPGQPGSISGPIAVNIDSTATYSISTVAYAATYFWTVSLGSIISGQGTSSISVRWNDTFSVGSVSVVATNPCGTSSAQTLAVNLRGQTFSYTGAQQTLTIPTGINSINITAYGAQGGSGGGLGGSASGTLSVTPGALLYVFVGGQNGFNGGGSGGNGANGGDMSDVRQGGTSFANTIIVAGGGGGSYLPNGTGGAGGGGNACSNGAGGGAGQAYIYQNTGYSGPGYDGTCTNGGDGGNGYGGFGGGGGGGGLTSGGIGGASGNYGQAGQTGSSGQGGSYGYNSGCGNNVAGGGGGGYYGGGGGANGQCQAGGGGGGSSWASGSLTNTSFSSGVQSGNGKIVITW